MQRKQQKYIVITGGVLSGIGKGVIASSTGLLLKTYGLRVTAIKIDPYLNIDAGTLSPLDHGEVFVLNDGGEVDLDLGNYERFLDVQLSRENNITTGKVYQKVIEKERKGDYLGKTVQIIPHVTDEIQDWVQRVAKTPVDSSGLEPDVCIIELGGTVGDIESAPFIEAMRQFQFRVGPENFCLIHVSLIPVVGVVGEQKSKPTQASVRSLRGAGLSPDILACRSANPLDAGIKQKLSMFCHVPSEQVIGVHDCPSVYHVPILLQKQGLITILEQKMKLQPIVEAKRLIEPSTDHDGSALWIKWQKMAIRRQKMIHDSVSIALVGKYTSLHDSYISVLKSLQHAALSCGLDCVVKWIEADDLEIEMKEKKPKQYHQAWQSLVESDGVLIPGGFGKRGTEGMVEAAKWARTEKKPFLGICLGLQVATIEFCRNVLGLKDANSEELNPDAKDKVVVFMPEVSKTHLGGTMRLGSRPTLFKKEELEGKWSIIHELYDCQETVHERHRHRYEVNPEYVDRLQKQGLMYVGRDESGQRMEIFELHHDPVEQWVEVDNRLLPQKGHPYYVGCQFHPEYLTRPLKPSPPFLGLILASANMLPKYFDLKNKNMHHTISPHSHFVLGEYGSEKSDEDNEQASPEQANKDPYTVHPFKASTMQIVPPSTE